MISKIKRTLLIYLVDSDKALATRLMRKMRCIICHKTLKEISMLSKINADAIFFDFSYTDEKNFLDAVSVFERMLKYYPDIKYKSRILIGKDIEEFSTNRNNFDVAKLIGKAKRLPHIIYTSKEETIKKFIYQIAKKENTSIELIAKNELCREEFITAAEVCIDKALKILNIRRSLWDIIRLTEEFKPKTEIEQEIIELLNEIFDCVNDKSHDLSQYSNSLLLRLNELETIKNS